MIKHVIKFEYLTADNSTPKNNVTIMVFPEIKSKDSNEVFIAVQTRLQVIHNLLVKRFPNMGFSMPRLKTIVDVKIIKQNK